MSSAAYASSNASARRRFPLETVVRPHTLLVIGVALSFAAWAIPWGSSVPEPVRGFAHAKPWTAHGMLFLLAWYGFFFFVAIGGFRLGRRIPVFERAERVPWESYYAYLTVLATVGTVYSYLYVLEKSPHAFTTALLHHQFNLLREVLPKAAGVQTLRYATCLAGAIAVFELGRRRFRLVHVLNVVLLLLAAAIASRISLIIATIALAGLAARHLQEKGTSLRRVGGTVLLGIVGLFLVLAILNYSRNADFYRQNGVRDPLAMNLDESIRYLGIPFQASVAVANAAHHWPRIPSTAAAGARVYLLPTYASSGTPAAVGIAEDQYLSLVSIPSSQTTNSVLASAYGVFGLLSFPLLGVVALVASVLAGYASRFRSYLFLAGMVLAYCFSDWWRIYMFNEGIVQFLVLSLVFWGLVGVEVDRRSGGRWSRFAGFILQEPSLPGRLRGRRTS